MTTTFDAPPAAPVLAGPNPFVGPQSLDVGQRIFGRDCEIDELYYLLSAERVVLLHSPSGAGKSSLIRAGLLPRLQQRFDVWGPTRVNTEPGPRTGVNRYVRSASLGFEQGLPEARRRSDEQLSAMSLADYVAQRPRRRSAPRPLVLVFDQFEEILTVDPLALDVKREFFRQLGEVLQNPGVWALFALREDYLAALDPYALEVPTQLRTRFRLDLLGRPAAEQAMAGIAAEGGRHFAPDAVAQLARDLATVQVQQLDGRFEKQLGPHVEPLHLQVACRGLWERMPADDLSIDLADIADFGNVDRALANYYDGAVGTMNGDERAARSWVGSQLITASGVRGQVLRGVGSSGGLDNDTIARLVNAHLVRCELRDGALWYELTHDRLIEPVQASNEAWFAQHLQPLQRDAALWESAGKPDRLLLRARDLDAANAWRAANPQTVLPVEQDLLDRSMRKRRDERLRAGLLLGVGGLLVAGAAYYVHQQQRQLADERERAAERELNVRALQTKIAGFEELQAATVVAREGQTADIVARRAANAALKQQVDTMETQAQGLESAVTALRSDNRTLQESIDRHAFEHKLLEGQIKSVDAQLQEAAGEARLLEPRTERMAFAPGALAAADQALSVRVKALEQRESSLGELFRQTQPCGFEAPMLVGAAAPAMSMVASMLARPSVPEAPSVPPDPADAATLRQRIAELARSLAALLAERARLDDESAWLQKEELLLSQQRDLLAQELARLTQLRQALQVRHQALQLALQRAREERASQLAFIKTLQDSLASEQARLRKLRDAHAELEDQTIKQAQRISNKGASINSLVRSVDKHTAALNPIVSRLTQAARTQPAVDLSAMLAVKAFRWAPYDTDDASTPDIYNTLWTTLRRVDERAALALITPGSATGGKLATTRSQVMVEALCARVGRALTADEWRRYMPQDACFTPQAASVCSR